MNVDVDDYTTEAKTQLPRPVRTSLPRDVLLGGAEFALKRGDRLSREDFTFARGMAALLRDDLEYYEDPVPGLDGMAELHRRTAKRRGPLSVPGDGIVVLGAVPGGLAEPEHRPA